MRKPPAEAMPRTVPRARTLLWIAWGLSWPAMAAALAHRSASPDVLGRWSTPLFSLVLLAGAALVATGMLLGRRSRDADDDRVLRGLRALRRTRLALLAAALGPIAAWLALAAALLARPAPMQPTALLCLLDLGLVVLLWEIALVLAERDAAARRVALAKAGFVALGTVVGLVLVEVVGRVALRGALPAWGLNPRHLDLRFASDEFDTRIVTNGQGLRESREIPPEHPGRLRVVAVGDSMTFGWGVDNHETYSSVTEALLRDRHGRQDVEVVNMGRAGYTLLDYLRLIHWHAAPLRPDVLVVGFVVGNDCPVFPPPTLRGLDEVRRLAASLAARARTPPDPGVSSSSFALRLARSGLRSLARRWQSVGDPWLPDPIYGTANPLAPDALLAEVRRQPDAGRVDASHRKALDGGWIHKGWRWEINPWLIKPLVVRPTGLADAFGVRAEARPAMRSEWRLCESLLLEMRAAATDLDAALVVLAIPWAYQVDDRFLAFPRELGCEVPAELTTTRVVNDWLVEFCERSAIACVDPLPRLRAHPERRVLYFERDAHLTPAGQREVAAALAEHLAGALREPRAR